MSAFSKVLTFKKMNILNKSMEELSSSLFSIELDDLATTDVKDRRSRIYYR